MTRRNWRWLPVCVVLMSCAHTPETPQAPVGSAWAVIDEPAEFIVSGESRGAVSCRIDWGDGDTSVWTQWVTSGVQVAVSHAWDTAGAYRVSTQARSSGGALSNWSGSATVRVLPRPGYPTRAVGRVQLRGGSRQMVPSPDGARLFVRNDRGELAAVRTSDLVAEACRAGFDDGFAVGRDGQHVYGLQNGIITKYRVTDWAAVGSLSLGDTLELWSMVASPTRDELYLLASIPGTYVARVLVVDGESLAVAGSMGRLAEAGDLALSPDGRAVYAPDNVSVYRFDTATREQTGVVPIGMFPVIAAVTTDGRWIYLADESNLTLTVVDAASFVIADRPPGTIFRSSYAVTPSGRFLFSRTRVGGFDSISVNETRTWQLVAKFDPGQAEDSWDYLVPSADGLRLYLASPGDSVVQVLGF